MIGILAEVLKQPQQLDCIKHPVVLELESLAFTPFHLISLILFAIAVVHTLSVRKIHHWAHCSELKQIKSAPPSEEKPPRSFSVQCLYFLSEIEIIFAFWAIPLFCAMIYIYDWNIAVNYLNTRDYTESIFVVVILSIAATRPIIVLAETTMHWIAQLLGGSLSAWWLTLLTIGPLLGSLITEVGAMTLCALLLSAKFYEFRPKKNLAYATLGLLFVNISVGGALLNFASPAVLILAHAWRWSSLKIFLLFGWKIILGILLSNLVYWVYFRKELQNLDKQKRTIEASSFLYDKKIEKPIPKWVSVAHILFMGWIVIVSDYPPLFIASFLCFIGFHQATRPHQYPIRLHRPLLVGLFLAGLIVHGGLQGWWILNLLNERSPLMVMSFSIILAAFNDNASIAYLTTLIPNWSELFKYAIFVGAIAGGGLTVIANAPNPAGYAILNHHFQEGIQPLRLFLAAATPTILLYLIFYFLGPLFP
jgi:hypothetical protein